MASINYPGSNRGAQIGINNGSITANFYPADITTIRALARSLHRSLSTSIDPFKQAQHELAFLLAALDIADSPSSPSFEQVHSHMISDMRECQQTLNNLREMKFNHDVSDSKTMEPGDLDDESINQLADIRQKLSSFTTTLSLVNTHAIRMSQEHVERMLKSFLEDESSRKKAHSIISKRSSHVSREKEEIENWKELRAELQSAGISPEVFAENLDLIVATLRRSDVGNDMPDLETLTQFTADLEDQKSSLARMDSRLTIDVPAPVQSIVSSLRERLYSLWPTPAVDFTVQEYLPEKEDFLTRTLEGNILGVMEDLERGANINSSNNAGDSALSIAAAAGHKEIVLLLLNKGAKVGSMNKKRETVIVQVAKNGRNEILSILQPHLEVFDKTQDHMALGSAAENGHHEMVKLLLDLGIDADYVDKTDEYDQTALFRAADKGHELVVRVLIKHGVSFNVLNYWNESALFAACRSNQRNVARLLVVSGARFLHSTPDDRKASSAAYRHPGLGIELSKEEMMRVSAKEW